MYPIRHYDKTRDLPSDLSDNQTDQTINLVGPDLHPHIDLIARGRIGPVTYLEESSPCFICLPAHLLSTPIMDPLAR